ncbi:sodium:hydrogen antiporter [Pedobacter antarcticus 4BY]|uniref:Sodium:hydrogen antiporter n=2 Tax=Pedobacter antarcticus TaxID=34086 RepID=A0A081PDF5_9SPHI|nr:Na+/H+ antiporter [Pedobacter antarcticus]KEQ28728.1 sodium:hydrogen antiporter [Pedobacter antarcticus 4BY]SFE89884.1 sodium/proton antiporter, CPA1 family (TC 2.A.36) [Pedobacter antarcticus]
MLENFPFYLSLILAIVLLIMLANKIKVAYPVLLVVAGLAISFLPGIPTLHIDPELIFFIFLPPLLYEASWAVSWKEMWRWRRIITSFAFVVVFLSAMSVAFVANHFIPGFSLALGFLLGGIVSPPDAVSAGAILKFVKIPKRMSSILEGESLLNDASSLIIFRFALVAVATGQFVWQEAALSFSWMVIGGVGIGVLIGWVFMKIHKHLPTDVNTDIVLTILAPYIMYLSAEEVHSSGVLAVVAGGLLLSNNRHLFLSSTSRLRGVNFWESFCFVLNGLVFMLIGLDLPEIVSGLEGVSISSAMGYGLLITAVLIVGRILSAYGAVVITLIASRFITVADNRNPGYKVPLILGWTGMRGVVSLAAALSIPVQLADGSAFPQRNLILFITFIVILVTLLLQGLTLPYLIRKIGIPNLDQTLPEEEVYQGIRKQLAQHSLTHLRTNYSTQLKNQPILQQMAVKWEANSSSAGNELMAEECKVIYLDILNEQRLWLLNKNQEEEALDEDIIRKHLQFIDLEEEKLSFS